MADNSIASRMRNCLERQIELFEAMAESRGSLPDNPDDEIWDELRELQAGFTKKLAAIDEERQLLRKEWEAAADMSHEQKEEVESITRKARAMARELSDSGEKDRQRILGMMDKTKKRLDSVLRGKSVLKKLKTNDDKTSGFLDKKA